MENKPQLIRRADLAREVREGNAYSILRYGTFPITPGSSDLGVYETTIPHGSKVAAHSHSQLEELLLFLTPAELVVESETYRVKAGDVMYLPRNTSHEITARAEEVRLLAIKAPNLVNDKVKKE